MRIARRLFIVPLADNNHGKTTIVNSLLSQGLGAPSPGQRGRRTLVSPRGREIDAYVFVRSYQETEKKRHKSVKDALDANDREWANRELIVFPSHVANSVRDIDEMITVAHRAGFDIICVAVLLDTDNRTRLARLWDKRWDERWTLPNKLQRDLRRRNAQLDALGRDLWMWICRALTP